MTDQIDTAEQEQTEQAAEQSAFAPITLEAANQLIAKNHNFTLDNDDPSLVTVTLHNAFLRDYEALMAHCAAKHADARKAEREAAKDELLELFDDFEKRLADFLEKSPAKTPCEPATVTVKAEVPITTYVLMFAVVSLVFLLMLITTGVIAI